MQQRLALARAAEDVARIAGPAQLRDMLAAVRTRGGFAIVDEIYQGLSYDHVPVSALALDPDVITVNSFSWNRPERRKV